MILQIYLKDKRGKRKEERNKQTLIFLYLNTYFVDLDYTKVVCH